MSKFLSKYSTYLRIGVSVGLFGFIAWRTDWSVVGTRFANLNIGLWLASVAVMVLAQVFSARRWQLFAQELGFTRTLSQYSAYYFIGTYFNLVLPTSVGGDVVRVWYLDGKSGRALAAFASVFLERINGLLVLIGVSCVGALVGMATGMELPWWIHTCVWGVAGCALLGGLSLPILQRWSLVPANRRAQLKALFDLVHVPKVLIGATFMSVLVQVIGVISFWLIGAALGLEVPVAYYCILGPMVSLLTLLPVSVNGIGLRELGTVVFLAPLSVDEDSAKTLAFLWFAASVSVSLLGGLVYLFGAYPKASTTNLANEGTDDNGSVDRDTDQGREREYKQAA
ncbi:MAG TPA: lysylphosphatidylglycerol synthase transmembrane domain-containing protein [Gemmataceae bacterium]|nr:lysylphosphatidylglycerol synthase transmembrane domain-containing protein [Gemmataceae bacterium]